MHKRVGEKWGEMSQPSDQAGGPPPPLCPTQMGALCSPKGGAEGDTLPPSKEQGKNIIPTPSKRSQQLLTKWLKIEREPPELTDNRNTASLITEQSVEITAETSSGEKVKDQCEYTTRGVCKLHNMRGEKYIVTKTEWRDRGGGRGFGNVYKRQVNYRCRTNKF